MSISLSSHPGPPRSFPRISIARLAFHVALPGLVLGGAITAGTAHAADETGEHSATTTSQETAVVRVNAGGPDYTDTAGRLWRADRGYNAGTAVDDGDLAIADTDDDALYATQRFDREPAPELQYAFALPEGDYRVRLHLAENYSGTAGEGLRVFDVEAEGEPLLEGVDVYAEAGGENRALVRSATVSVTDGELNLRFLHQTENPTVAAIEVLPVDDDGDEGDDGTVTDTDGDGLPDEWETRYGLDPNDPDDADGDLDGDGVSNLDEYLAGTDPTTAPDSPEEAGTATVSWTAPTTRTDGSSLSLSEIDGYRIYYGTEPGVYEHEQRIEDAATTEYRFTDLEPGTYYFTVTTVDSRGMESPQAPAESITLEP